MDMEVCMSTVRALLSFVIPLFACSASFAQNVTDNYGVGRPSVFIGKYQAFRAERIRSGEANILRINLGHVKGLSRSFAGAAGEIAIDLRTGKYLATLRGLKSTDNYSLWLVDRAEPEGGVALRFNAARALKLADVRGTSSDGERRSGRGNSSGFFAGSHQPAARRRRAGRNRRFRFPQCLSKAVLPSPGSRSIRRLTGALAIGGAAP